MAGEGSRVREFKSCRDVAVTTKKKSNSVAQPCLRRIEDKITDDGWRSAAPTERDASSAGPADDAYDSGRTKKVAIYYRIRFDASDELPRKE